MLRSSVQWSLLALILLAGCGGKSDVAAQSAASGKTSDAPVAATSNASRSEVKAERPIAQVEPVDACQFAKVLDLGKLPMPEGTVAGLQSPTQLEVNVPLAVPSAVEFFLGKLDSQGWKRVGPATSDSITDSFAQVSLGKDGYLLLMTAISGEPKHCGVTIHHVGNFDSRSLPRVAGAEDMYSSQADSLYFAATTVEKATAEIRQLFKAAGWQEYDRAFSQKGNRPDAADMLFRKKGYSVNVSITKPAAKPDKTAVQYALATLARDLPAPVDAKHVEIADSRWILMCDVPGDRNATADFYRKAMREIGFTAPPYETSSDKALSLSFESPDHDLVLVSLTPAAERGTKVKLEGYTAAFREALKKAEEADRVKREAAAKAEAKDKAERIKAFNEASKKQDDAINAAIGNAIKEATQPKQPSDLSKKIQDDVKSELEDALPGKDASPSTKPDDKSAK